MFGYIDTNGIISHPSLSSLFQHKKESVQKSNASLASKHATDEEKEATEKKPNLQKVSHSYEEAKKYLESGFHNVLAAQIMSHPVVTINADSTIKDTWSLFQEKRFRHIPVISKEDKLIGIISDRDILKYGIKNPAPDSDPDSKTTIEGIFKKNVIFANPDAPVRQIVYVLIQKKIGSMPIVNNQGFILGIITRSDILKHFVSTSPLDLSV